MLISKVAHRRLSDRIVGKTETAAHTKHQKPRNKEIIWKIAIGLIQLELRLYRGGEVKR